LSLPFSYTLVRSSKRKTIALQIKNEKLTVRAPQLIPQDYINQLLTDKMSWIVKKIADSRQKTSPPPVVYLPDNTILIHGIPRKISLSYQHKANTTLNEDSIEVSLPLRLKCHENDLKHLEQQIKKQLASWMKKQVMMYLDNALPELSSKLNLMPTAYKVRLYKARWGSCNNKGELSFNYLLAMVPYWVINYVIIHELCHIKHLNHSAQFWQLVSQYQPNYKEADTWLKKHQSQIII